MRRIGIQWAKLARVFLCTGSCLIMKDKLSESNFMKWGYKNQVAAAIVLFGTCSLTCRATCLQASVSFFADILFGFHQS